MTKGRRFKACPSIELLTSLSTSTKQQVAQGPLYPGTWTLLRSRLWASKKEHELVLRLKLCPPAQLTRTLSIGAQGPRLGNKSYFAPYFSLFLISRFFTMCSYCLVFHSVIPRSPENSNPPAYQMPPFFSDKDTFLILRFLLQTLPCLQGNRPDWATCAVQFLLHLCLLWAPFSTLRTPDQT